MTALTPPNLGSFYEGELLLISNTGIVGGTLVPGFINGTSGQLIDPTVVLFKKPAPTLAAMKGMKVRTFASPLQIEPMKSIGAIPVPLALTEVIPPVPAETATPFIQMPFFTLR